MLGIQNISSGMREGVRQRLSLAEIVDNCQLKLKAPEMPLQALQYDVYDLHTLVRFANSHFLPTAIELRKKAAAREKMFRQSEHLAMELQELFASQPGANYQIAYNVLSLTSPPIIKHNNTKILKELKLAFLQSQGVRLNEWGAFFRPQQRALAISVPESNAEVFLGLQQKKDSKELEWVVIGASMGGQNSRNLFDFVETAIKESRSDQDNWQRHVIRQIKCILTNLQALEIYFQLYNKFARKEAQKLGESKQTLQCPWESISGMTVDSEWNILFDCLGEEATFHLKVQEAISLSLIVRPNALSGSLQFTSSFNAATPIYLRTTVSKLNSQGELLLLSKIIYTFQNSIDRLYSKYPFLQEEQHYLFVRILGKLWLPDQLSEAEAASASKQGVWMFVPIEGGMLLQIDEQGDLCSTLCDKQLLSRLLGKKLTLADTCRHVRLFDRVKIENDTFQYRVYEIRLGRWGSPEKDYAIYEFRSNKFIDNLKHLKANRNQDKWTQLDKHSGENVVLVVRLSLDFTKVYFSSWRANEGPRTEAERSEYNKKDWIDYQKQIPKGEKISWQRLADALCYYCRCYMVERLRNKIWTEEDRRVNSLELN